MSNEFRLLNGNGIEVNTYASKAAAERIQKFYEGSRVQQLVNGVWEDV